MGHPLDTSVMMGAQASGDQMEKILSYVQVGKNEGAKVRIGGERAKVAGLESGYYMQPTVFEGKNDMRVFQEEIFGPVVAVTPFKDEAEALKIANHTLYGLGAGVWTRNVHAAWDLARGIKAGRVWTDWLPPLPGARLLRRLQAVGDWSGDAQDDAVPLHADQERADLLLAEADGLLLRA